MNETETWFDDMTMDEIDKLGREINDQGFDHVFQITRGGVVDGPSGVHAPDVRNDEEKDIEIDQLPGDKWSALTGYTWQDHYSGPVMHASEFIGGRLLEDLIEMSAEAEAEGKPLLWTVTTAQVDPDEEEEHPEPAGWVILRREI
jgi:hypothetical protein